METENTCNGRRTYRSYMVARRDVHIQSACSMTYTTKKFCPQKKSLQTSIRDLQAFSKMSNLNYQRSHVEWSVDRLSVDLSAYFAETPP